MTDDQLLNSQVKKNRFFYGYTIVIASFLILMIVFGAQFSFGVFFKLLLNEFGWTRAATSGAYSLCMILSGTFGIFAGRLNDRFGPRPVVTISGLILGLGYLLMSLTSTIWQIYLFYGVIISLGISGIWVPLMSTVARWFIKRRGLVSGIAAAGIGVGIVIMPPVANQLISSYSWRTSYIIIGLIALVIITILAQFLKRDPHQVGLSAYGTDSASTNNPDSEIQGFSLQEAIRTKQFWIICVMFLFANFSIQTVLVHIVPHATDTGVSEATAATILSLIGLVSIGVKIGAGSMGDRIGNKRVVIIVLALMSISFLWLLFANELWMLFLFAIALGFSYGGYATAQSPIIAEYFGLKAHGAILGLVAFVGYFGNAFGPFVSGSIFDATGSYRWAFIVCAILSLSGAVLLKSLKVLAGHRNDEGKSRNKLKL